MTNTTTQAPKAPLGIGDIISESFSILFGNFVKALLLGFAGAFLGFVISAVFLGFGVATGAADPTVADPASFLIGMGLSTILSLVVYGLVTALLIQLAYDAKLGRSSSFGDYIKVALPAILPIAVLSIVIGILSALGAIALIIGALWVYAVFYVTAPVVVIERGGFGSMSRSASLTKEYRWPIVGLFIVTLILSFILQFVAGFIVTLLVSLFAGFGGMIVAGIGLSIVQGIAYAFGGIVTALVYARLREIKEGVDVDQIAAVFE